MSSHNTFTSTIHVFTAEGPSWSVQETVNKNGALAGTLLIYRANESLTYTSTVYGATETVDARYAGSTTVDIRNQGKLALRGQFDDFQAYTHDTGQGGTAYQPGPVRPRYSRPVFNPGYR